MMVCITATAFMHHFVIVIIRKNSFAGQLLFHREAAILLSADMIQILLLPNLVPRWVVSIKFMFS